jgi:hypothetical protein
MFACGSSIAISYMGIIGKRFLRSSWRPRMTTSVRPFVEVAPEADCCNIDLMELQDRSTPPRLSG